MPLRTFNPTFEDTVAAARPAPRPSTLHGATVGLLDNSKRNVGHFLADVEDILREEHGVGEVVRARKANMSAPAPDDVMAQLTACDVVFSAIGD